MTAAIAKKIADRHHNGYNRQERAHPLDGMSTAEFVRTARAGWPKVPVPADTYKAAQRVFKKWGDLPEREGGLMQLEREE